MSKSTKKSAEVLAEVTPVATTIAQPEIKVTAVEDRLYDLASREGEPTKFRGKQRQIVYDILRNSTDPMRIKDVAAIAEEQGLKAVGGVEPSVRYHLHHLTKDGFTVVTNPTFELEPIPSDEVAE